MIDLDIDFSNKYNVSDLLEYLIKYYDLKDYINNIYISNEISGNSYSKYNFYTNDVDILLGNINQEYIAWNNINGFNYSTDNRYKSLLVLDTVLHVLSHAEQYRNSLWCEDQRINALCKSGIDIYNDKNIIRKLLNKLFFEEYSLLEHNAECEAKSKIIKLNDENVFLNPTEEFFIRNFLFQLLHSESPYMSLAEKYYTIMGKRSEYKKLDLTSSTEYMRRSWGLPNK